MIVLFLTVSLLFVLIAFFSGDKIVKFAVAPSCMGMLITYFFAIEWNPFDTVSSQNLEWLTVMSVDVGLGFSVNPVGSLLLMTLLLIALFFLPLVLESFHGSNAKRKVFLSLSSIFFLMTGILSTGMVMFLISWLILGVIVFTDSSEHFDRDERVSKFFYIGMDGFLMFFGLLLLSAMFSSTSFNVINDKFGHIVQEEKGIVLLGFLIVSTAVFIRSSLFPFLFGSYGKDSVVRSPYVHMFRFLTMTPLGYILMVKMNQAMNIPFFSNMFFVLGMTTSFIVLIAALTRNSAVEILNLENGAMMGMAYALLGLGQVATSVIFFVAFLLLKSSITMLFSIMQNKNSKKKYFIPMTLLVGAYVGIPGLTNFFPFFDAAWAFWGMGAGPFLFAFVVLNGVLYAKLISIIFNFKSIFSSEPVLEKMNKRIWLALFPGIVSFLGIFYCIPPNLASVNSQILKGKILKYFGRESVAAGSMQEQNIVMILLFVSVAGGISLGTYIFIARRKSLPWERARIRFDWINRVMDWEWGLDKLSQTLLIPKGSVWKCPWEPHLAPSIQDSVGLC